MSGNNVFQIQVSQSADQFWDGIPGSPDLLLVNLDDNDNITVGPTGIQPAGLNGFVIAPGQPITVAGTQAWSAVTDASDSPLLQIIPGGGNYGVSALAIAGQIAASGLALAIAEEIAAQGLTFIGAPQALYGGTISPPPSGSSLFGATVGYNLYGGGTTAEIAACNTLNGYVNRSLGAVAGKYYMNSEGAWDTSIRADYAALITAGSGLLVCVKPWHTASGTYTDSTVTAGGNTCLQEKNNFAALLTLFANAYTAAGFTPATLLKVCIVQEPEAEGYWKSNQAHYAAFWQYYQTAITAAGLLRVYDPGSGKGEATMAAYYPGDAYVDEIVADYYSDSYANGITLATVMALADNHLPSPIPFGLGEFNAQAVASKLTQSEMTTQWNNYMGYLTNLFVGRLSAGKTNSWIMMYMGYNVAAVPLPYDEINSAADFKIPGLQSFYDAVASTSAASGATIGTGNTYTVPPLTPTPGGKFAMASGLSYDISLTLIAGAASTIPFVTVQMDWLNQDSTSATPVATQYWSVPMGTNGTAGTVITGEGPQRGQFLRVRLTNKDTVTCTLVSCMVNSTSRSVTKHDWSWDVASSVSVPTYTNLAAGGKHGNSLGSVNSQSIGASSSKSWLFGMFTGEVWFRCTGNSGANLQYTLNPQPSGVWGSAALINESPAGEFGTLLVLPRAPCLVTVANSDASNAHSANIEIIAND